MACFRYLLSGHPVPVDGKVSDGPAPAARLVQQRCALGYGPLGHLDRARLADATCGRVPGRRRGLNILVAGTTQTGKATSC